MTAVVLTPAKGNASPDAVSGNASAEVAHALAEQIRRLEQQDVSPSRSTALQSVARAGAAAAALVPIESAVWRRLQSDRLYALLLAGEDHLAIAAYRELTASGANAPDYVTMPLASALVQQGQIEEGLSLMEELASRKPEDPDPAIRLAYLLSDAGRYPAARAPLASWLERQGSGGPGSDEQTRAVELALARVDRWHGQLVLAHTRLRAVSATDQGSAEWALERATLLREMREPRAALALVAARPDKAAAAVAAQAWLDLGRPDLARVSAEAAGEPGLAARAAALELGRGRFDASYGNTRSPALTSPNGANESAASAFVDSPLMGSRWRVGAAMGSQRAEFRGVEPRVERVGIRVVRHGTGGETFLEAGRTVDDFLPGGYGILRSDFWLSDHWRLSGRMAINDPESSLQARASGIGSDAVDGAATYRPYFDWRFDFGAGHRAFDDGNRRNWGSVSAEHRLSASDTPTVSGYVSIYTSTNSHRDAAYFNPTRDGSLDVGMVAGFPGPAGTWQTIRPAAALYWQEGFGSSLIPRLRYGIRLPLRSGRGLEGSLSASRPVYDGRRESQWSMAIAYTWGQP